MWRQPTVALSCAKTVISSPGANFLLLLADGASFHFIAVPGWTHACPLCLPKCVKAAPEMKEEVGSQILTCLWGSRSTWFNQCRAFKKPKKHKSIYFNGRRRKMDTSLTWTEFWLTFENTIFLNLINIIRTDWKYLLFFKFYRYYT